MLNLPLAHGSGVEAAGEDEFFRYEGGFEDDGYVWYDNEDTFGPGGGAIHTGTSKLREQLREELRDFLKLRGMCQEV